MKNFNLIEMAKAMKEHKLRHMWRYAAMMALLLGSVCGQAWGVEITINRFALDGTTILPLNTTSMFLQDEVDFVYSGTPSLSSGGLSIAASSTTTISAHGKTITGMTIVFNSANNTSTVNTGSITGWTNSNKTMAWSGSATSITITSGVATRINSAVITYTDATPLSGVSSTTLTTFIRPYNANNISIIGASKSPSAPGVNISGAFDSNVKLNYNTSTNGTSTNAIRIVSPKAISSIVYTWSTAPTATQTSSGSYDSGTSTWTAANTTTTDVSLYNRGSAKAVFSKIVVNFVGSTPSCTSITPTWSTDYSSTTLNVGATSSTPVVGKDGSSGTVTFSSSDATIASVNESTGVVTGVGAGTATITATVAANGDYCSGTVTKEFTIKAGITYNANSATGGSVPTDDNTYAYNANITVAGNTGSLYKTGFVFNGWNTRSDGTGTHYEAGATMKMPSKSTGVTLYAEWVGYATSWEWWNCGQSNNSTTFTYITSKNYICSFASSASTAVASWDIEGGEYYRGIKIKTKDHSIAFWVQTGKRVSITFGTRPTKPTFTVGGVDKSSEVGASTNADSITVTYTTTGDTKFYIENETATNTAFTVKSVKIEDDAPSCTAPNHVDISGNWDYFGGETISLTATPYSSAGTGSPITSGITGYQWQKLISSTWTDVEDGTDEGTTISGATTANLQIAGCTGEHSGKYRCTISTGATCSTSSATATDGTEGFQVKVFTLECYTGGTTVYHFTRIGETQTGSTTITLAASTGYQFKFHIDGTYYGNSGTINEDVSNWVCTSGAGNLTINSGLGGTFTITMDYSDGGSSSTVGEPEISVTYPRKTIYLNAGGSDLWDKDNAKFGIYYFRKESETLYGHAWTDIMPAYACGSGIYVTEIPQWNGVKINAVRLNPSATNDNKSDWWDDYKYNQTNDCPVSSNDYITITGWNEANYTYTTYDAPEYTISFDGNGETSGSMTDVEDIECDASVTLEANAFVKTGYTFANWTANVDVKVGGATVSAGSAIANSATIQNVSSDITLTAQWSPVHYNVSTSLTNVTVSSGTTGTGAATHGSAYSVTLAGETGYNLPTTVTVTIGGSPATLTTDYTWNSSTGVLTVLAAKVTGDISISATGVAKTTAITLEAGEGGTDGSATATYGSSTITDYEPATRTGYTLGNYYKDDGDRNILTKEGTLNTGNKGSLIVDSKWASEDAAVTLYAQWTATSYTLSYDLAGGSVASPNPTSYTIESSAITLNNPTKTGYTFAGWTGTDLVSATTTVTIAAGSTGNRSYTATWTPIVPSSVSLNKTSTTITVGGTETLTATISPAVVADNTITWTSSDGTVATVTSAGVVTGVKAGTATITATTHNDKTATCEVTVAPAVTYTVTYVYNGATGGDDTPSATGASVSLPNPTKTGYTLQGWYTSSGSLAGAATATYNPTSNITLYALWREDECSGGGGGGSTTLISYTITEECTGASPCDHTASGTPGGTAYLFKLKTSNDKYKLNNDPGDAIPGSYFALKLSSGYFQTGDVLTMDGSKAMQVYTGTHGSGTLLAATSGPSDGVISYTLPNTLPNNTNEIYVYRSSSTYNGTLTYMTVTRAGGGGSGTCYYVTYNGNGADGGFTKDEASHPSGSDVTVASNSFTKTGYTFTGWNTEAEGTGTPYTASGTISGISGNMTLYAQWSDATEYDISTSATNGTISTKVGGSEVTSAEASATVTITATPSTGYSFSSWTVTDEDEGSVTVTSSTTNPTTFTMPAKAVTVSATFSEITHTVSVAAGAHGTVSPSSVSGVGIATASGDITATPATGYSFNGWTLPSGVTAAAGKTASSNPIQINATADDKTITATWTAKSYTLTLDKNHSSASAAASTSSVDYDATSFTPTAPTYDGHSVDGYYTSANCTTLVATAAGALQASITVSEVVWTNSSSEWKKDGAATFYAHWKCNTPSISCTDNVVTITVPTGSTVYYTTNGSTPTAGSLEYDPSDKPTISANTTIKAIAIQSGCTSSDVASEDCTFTGDCEETTLFSMIVKSSIDDYSLAASTTVTNSDDAVSSRLTSISGGTLSIENTTKSSSKTVFDYNCLYISSNDVYYTITLSGSKTLQAGDSITITTRTAYSPYITTSSTRAENPTMTKSGSSDPYTYTLTIANTSAATGKNLIGYGTFYLWKNSSAAQIHSIKITRPCVDATHSISYDKGEGTGTMSSHASIAHNGSQELTSNSFTAPDNYTFAGWVADVDVTIGGSTVTAGTLIADGATITNITSDIALTAKWKQTITLNANTSNHGSGDNTSAVAILNGTVLNSISHTTAASGYKLAGYYTAATSGTKVLNSDGSFASTAVTDYISDSKWTRTGAAPTLYAQYEASGSIKWNLVVNSDTTVLSTSTKNSSYTEISTSNMTDAAVNGVTYTHSAKSGLTGKISTPAYDADKYVKVTFQVASGYKFTPSLIQVPIQPVGDGEHKAVELRLTDESSHSLVSASATKCDGITKGKKTTVTLAGDGSTYFTGTVTLKIYVYPHGDATESSNNCYRLGTPIQIDGAVEATCTMPSYESVSYSQTEYVQPASASAISVVGASGDPSYQWKYNSTGDRTSGTNCGTEASVTPSTESTGTLYYWCELTNACGTVKTPAVAITVSASKSTATVTWTDPSTPNYGGGGYTIRATVNDDSWDGSASDLTITAPAGIRIYNTTTGTDGSSKKYIEVKFDVQTAFDRETYSSNIPFTVSADATTSYNAISADHNVSYSACSGGGGSATEELMAVDASHIDNSTWKGGWVYDGIGMMRYGHGSSDISAGTKDANLNDLSYTMASGNITKYYKSASNHFGFYTEKAITGIRLYVYTSNDNVTVSNVYVANSAYTSGTPSSGAVSFEAEYNDGNDALRSGTHSGSAWVDITFDKEVAAEKYGQINLSNNVNIAGMAFISASGSGATLTTTLAFATTGTIAKTQSAANFTNAASVTAYSETLGAITYSSSNTDCATVDSKTGEVTITASGASDQSTTITATLAASGCYKGATTTYTITVAGVSCTVNHGTLASDVTTKCSTADATLTLTGFDSGATVQWYKGESTISDGVTYDITTEGTTSTMVTKEVGTYSVMVTKDECSDRSNSITISNYSAEVAATKIVDKWYIKHGRVTPDIALWALDEGTHLSSVAWSPSNATGLTAADDFYESDGIVYLKGTEPSSNESSDVEYTLTLTVKDECENTTALSTSDKQITLTHQKNTDKHVLAFVVEGTAKGGFTAGISADQTTGVELYNEIAKTFDVQATNIYSTDDEQKLKEYYSQFDILCITDYPNTGKTGTNKKSYVDAIGSLIDIRPILTMEAFVSKLDNWKSKGISGTPKSPTTRQYSMLLQCKDHEIFSGTNPTTVGSGDETMYRIDMVDKTLEDYATLDATYGAGAHAEKSGYEYGSKPALQGFTYDASMSSLLPIGRIDDGAENDLEVGVERQAVMEARLLVLGINGYAMERLDDDGLTIVINALKYLMKKNAEDISDCSNYFVGGAEGDPYSWKNLDNWSGSTLPDRTQEVRIVAPCVISDTIARASSVKIVTGGTYSHGTKTANGSLTINPTGSLIVEGKIYAATAPNFFEQRTTEPENLVVKANESKTGTLIFDNENGDTQATIEMYSPSHWEVVAGKYVKYWSYVGMPIKDVHIPDYFYGAFTYYFNEAKGWEKRFDNDIMQPFEGIGLSMQEGHKETFYGTMVSTENTDITITNHTGYGDGDNLIGNSWTAPIQIANFDAEDFGSCWATVYIFNTGKGGNTYVNANADNDGAAKAGQWLGIPIGVAGLPEYSGLKVIPAMNAFLVHDTLPTSTTLHLDYDKLVREDATTNTQINEKMRAPSRHPRKKKDVDGLMRIRVVGEKTNTDVWMLQDARFSEGFDNGWEARYNPCDDRSAQLYARSKVGVMSFIALPDLDGTVLGFAPSRDGNDYTFTFQYRGEDEYYLNDLKLQQSVLIDADNNYAFTYEKGDTNRFYVSRTPLAPQTPTGVDNASGATQSTKAIKVIYNGKLYIIRSGRVYSAEGILVK